MKSNSANNYFIGKVAEVDPKVEPQASLCRVDATAIWRCAIYADRPHVRQVGAIIQKN